MRKILLIVALCLSSIIALAEAVELQYEDFSAKEPVIRSGLKAAKQNIKTDFVYNEGDMYRIYCRAGFLTTINLNPDEEVIYIAGGDTARWAIDKGETGSRDGKRTIITLKPFYPGIKTNLIVNTNKRSYQFFLHSANDWYNPSVQFLYPQDEKLAQMKIQEKIDNTIPVKLENLNYDYTWKKTKDKWSPEIVFDDGEKTFILMPERVNSSELPALFIRDEQTGQAAMVRHRYLPETRYYIVDRLFEQGILQYGKKKIVIKRNGSFIKNPKDYYPVKL